MTEYIMLHTIVNQCSSSFIVDISKVTEAKLFRKNQISKLNDILKQFCSISFVVGRIWLWLAFWVLLLFLVGGCFCRYWWVVIYTQPFENESFAVVIGGGVVLVHGGIAFIPLLLCGVCVVGGLNWCGCVLQRWWC